MWLYQEVVAVRSHYVHCTLLYYRLHYSTGANQFVEMIMYLIILNSHNIEINLGMLTVGEKTIIVTIDGEQYNNGTNNTNTIKSQMQSQTLRMCLGPQTAGLNLIKLSQAKVLSLVLHLFAYFTHHLFLFLPINASLSSRPYLNNK